MGVVEVRTCRAIQYKWVWWMYVHVETSRCGGGTYMIDEVEDLGKDDSTTSRVQIVIIEHSGLL